MAATLPLFESAVVFTFTEFVNIHTMTCSLHFSENIVQSEPELEIEFAKYMYN